MNKRHAPLTEEQMLAEIARLDAVVDEFAQVMKNKLADKVREGYEGWDNPAMAEQLYTSLLAHAASHKLAQGQELTVANLAMFLWYQRTHTMTWIRDDEQTARILRLAGFDAPIEAIESWSNGQIIEAEQFAIALRRAMQDFVSAEECKNVSLPIPPHIAPYRRAA